MDWVGSESLIPLLHSLDAATLATVYEAPEMLELWNTIGYLNQRGIHGDQIVLNFMGWTPTWIGGSGSYGVASHITAGKESEFATMVASLVYYGRLVKNVDFTLTKRLRQVTDEFLKVENSFRPDYLENIFAPPLVPGA